MEVAEALAPRTCPARPIPPPALVMIAVLPRSFTTSQSTHQRFTSTATRPRTLPLTMFCPASMRHPSTISIEQLLHFAPE